MFDANTIIWGQRWPTFTLLLTLAGIVSVLWLLWTAERGQRGAVFDTLLASVAAAIMGGRLLHVALHWTYYSQNRAAIADFSQQGGLNWQGALWAALLTIWLVGRWRAVDWRRLLAQAAPLLPLIALAGWAACDAAACGYGAPVASMADYPAWVTWIAPDVYGLIEPRFAVQPLAMRFAALLLLLIVGLRLWRGVALWQMPLALLLWSAVSFGLGFLRGDAMPIWDSLRADQWLDGLTFFGALLLLWGTACRQSPPDDQA